MARSSRSLKRELEIGINENTYMVLHPDWGGAPLREPATERLDWPTYREVKREVPRKNIATLPLSKNAVRSKLPKNKAEGADKSAFKRDQ